MARRVGGIIVGVVGVEGMRGGEVAIVELVHDGARVSSAVATCREEQTERGQRRIPWRRRVVAQREWEGATLPFFGLRLRLASVATELRKSLRPATRVASRPAGMGRCVEGMLIGVEKALAIVDGRRALAYRRAHKRRNPRATPKLEMAIQLR